MEQERTASTSKQLVSFRMGKEEFGVDILKVKEIVRLQPMARVPETPEYIEGIINLRGNVIPVIDLKKKLGMGKLLQNKQTRIIVFGVDKKIIGILVDSVEQVLRIPEDKIELPPEIGVVGIKDFLTGVGKLGDNLLLILNIVKVLTETEPFNPDEIKKVKETVQSRDIQKQSENQKEKPVEA